APGRHGAGHPLQFRLLRRPHLQARAGAPASPVHRGLRGHLSLQPAAARDRPALRGCRADRRAVPVPPHRGADGLRAAEDPGLRKGGGVTAKRLLISVVTPCYNEEDNLEDCRKALRELFDTKLPEYDLEHIFCDNASTDGSEAVLRAMAAAHPEVK